MPHQLTELISPEEAIAKFDVHAPGASIMLYLGKLLITPANIHASNMRAMRRSDNGTTTFFYCEGVVTREPLVFGQKFVIVESIAMLLGFYNNGVDTEGKPIIVAAYGQPFIHRAFNVVVGSTVNPTAYTSSFHYDTVVFPLVSEIEVKRNP